MSSALLVLAVTGLTPRAPPGAALRAVRCTPTVLPCMLADKRDGAYYQRPSAALERGGNFYVPGLEGTRLRVAAATVLSVGLVANRLLSGDGPPPPSQSVSEALGALGCAIVFVQSALQLRADAAAEQDALRAAFASRLKERQQLDATLPDLTAERARWAAATLLRLTPARAVVWATAKGVCMRYGRFSEGDQQAAAESSSPASAAAAALRVLLRRAAGDGRSGTLEADSGSEGLEGVLPGNSVSVALCACGEGGVLALASEQPAAFSDAHVATLEYCAALIATGEADGRGA